jgi:hypothetical protein
MSLQVPEKASNIWTSLTTSVSQERLLQAVRKPFLQIYAVARYQSSCWIRRLVMVLYQYNCRSPRGNRN